MTATLIDGAAVAGAIRRLFERRKIQTSDVAASLSGNAVIVKKITLPVMTDAELAESIYWEAEQYIPFDIQDVNLDYEVIDPGTGPESQGAMEVLLVAAKKDKIADYIGVIEQAGRVPGVLDGDGTAIDGDGVTPGGLTRALLRAGAEVVADRRIVTAVAGDQPLAPIGPGLALVGGQRVGGEVQLLDLAVGVAVALVHKPSTAERASDMRGFLHDVTYNIESCAAGVRE